MTWDGICLLLAAARSGYVMYVPYSTINANEEDIPEMAPIPYHRCHRTWYGISSLAQTHPGLIIINTIPHCIPRLPMVCTDDAVVSDIRLGFTVPFVDDLFGTNPSVREAKKGMVGGRR